MSWLQKLYQTYEQCAGSDIALNPAAVLEPICHTSQQAQIEVTIDGRGNMRAADVLTVKGQGVTLVPCTEASGGRSGSKPINHPLCDKLQYLAGDFVDFGASVTTGFAGNPLEPHQWYLDLLRSWAESPFSHPKVMAILAYVQRNSLVADLVAKKILPIHMVDGKATLLQKWDGDKAAQPKIFSVMANGSAPEDAFVRWRVELPGDLQPETWRDQSLINAWVGYYSASIQNRGLCLVTGETTSLARQHGAKIRHAADKAKLISANDSTGFTFRGRFSEAEQACAVGFDVSQKAHSALRWLIRRQAFRNNDQVVVAWHVAGAAIPDPMADTSFLLDEDDAPATENHAAIAPTIPAEIGDVGQTFGKRLSKRLAGYGGKTGIRNEIVIMALDSATTGRLAITYYREFDFPEFIERIEQWHTRHAWLQDYGKDKRFIGTPAPKDIAEACYGSRLDEKLSKATVERLLPCIMDGKSVPRDLMEMAVRRACNRIGLKFYEWEKYLGIACGLFRGYQGINQKEEYQMALETERVTPDYLFGRLLAIADNIEQFALADAGVNRETEAERLMQRFADHPCATWRNIELKLKPYCARLRSRAPKFLVAREILLAEVMDMFNADDFIAQRRLSGEFLLGFHCQRQALRKKSDKIANIEEPTAEIATNE